MTEQLPIPLSRADCYLATAAGMTGVILPADGPKSREEDYLAYMAGDTTIVLPTPGPLKEQWLAIICGDTSVTTPEIKGAFLIGQQMVRVEFLAKAAGVEGIVLPTNPNRTEQYFANIGGIVPDPGVLTQAKGTYIVLNNVLRGIDSLDYIYGDTFQQTYSGKNLLEGMPWRKVTTSGGTPSYNPSAGVTIVSSDNNNIEFSADANYTGVESNFIALSNNTQITVSFTGILPNRFWITQYDSNKTRVSTLNPSSGNVQNTTVTTTQDGYIAIAFASTMVGSFKITNIQLELGFSSTSFEPYCGGIPSPNPDYPQDIQVVTGEQTVNVHGKNLFDFDNGTIFYGGNISHTNDSNSIIMTASGVTGAQYSRVTFSGLDATKNYTISGKAKKLVAGSDGSPFLRVSRQYSDDGITWTGFANIYTTNEPVEGTEYSFNGTVTGHAYWRFLFYNNGAGTVTVGESSTYYDVQLEEGSTPTTYEPYQSQDYKVHLTSKNLVNFGTLTTSGCTYTENNGVYTVTATANNPTMRFALQTKIPAGTYTWDGANSLSNWTISPRKSDGTSLGVNGYSVPKTATTTDEMAYIYFYSAIQSGETSILDLSNFQLEVGNKATSYQPYYNYELAKIGAYQDYIYKSGDDWYVHKKIRKIVYSGSEDWITRTGKSHTFQIPVSSSISGMSNYFTNIMVADFDIKPGMYAVSSNSLIISYPDMADLAAFTTWLGTHNLVFYEILSVTPTDTKITDTTLISELEAVDSAVLPTPDAFIQVTGNLAGEIEISYYAKSE